MHDSGAGQPSVGFIALAGFLEDVGSLFQGIAGGASVSVVVFLELVRAPSDGDAVGVRFVAGGVREDARAGGVRDLGQLVEVVVGVLDAGRGVAVGDGVVDPLFQVVAPGGDHPPRVRERGFEVQGIVGGVFMGAVRPGFADEQARGFVVAPRSDVPVRASRGVGGDVARVFPERGEAGRSVRLIIAKKQRLGGRAVFRCFAAPEVVAVTRRFPESVGDDGWLVKEGIVGCGRRIACRVRHRDRAPGKVGLRRGRVATAVGVGVDDAGFRVGAGMRGRDARMVRLRDDKTVDDRSGGRDVGGGDATLLRPQGARSVFAPLRRDISPGINGDCFTFQCGGEAGNERFLRFAIGCALAVVSGRRDDTVHAVLRLFRSVAPRGDARVGHGGGIGEFPGFFRPVAEVVVFPQGRGHRRGRIARVRLFFGHLPFGVVSAPCINDATGGVGPACAQGFPGSVDDAALQLGFRFPGDGFREGPHAIGNQINGMNQMPLSCAGLFHHRSVRRAARDERSPGGDGLRRRQTVLAVGVGGDPAQDVGGGGCAAEKVIR